MWAVQAGGPGFDKASAVTTDHDGHIIVTGYFQDTATFGALTLTSIGFKDIFVAKYDANGNALWVTQGQGDAEDEGMGVATDADGNIFVTGAFFEQITFGATTLTGNGSYDVFIVKYDPDGNVLWALSQGGTSLDRGFAIATDADGNIAVTGHFQETAQFGTASFTSDGVYDLFVASYDADGNFRWANKAGGAFVDEGNAIAIDTGGHTVITGKFSGAVTFDGIALASSRLFNTFIARYDPDGNLQWVRKAGGRDDFGSGLATDAQNNIFVTGYFQRTGRFEGITNTFTLESAGSGDAYLAKYDPLGEILWVVQGGGTDLDRGLGVAIDQAGNPVVTGFFAGASTFGNTTLTSTFLDAFIAKYDMQGNALWVAQAGGGGLNEAYSIVVDGSGNTIMAGLFTETATFDNQNLTSVGEEDVFIAKWGSGATTDTETNYDLGQGFILAQNYPNPFRSDTRIAFQTPINGPVTLEVHTLLGRKVRTLMNGYIAAGNHTVLWDSRDDTGRPVASGAYLYRLQSDRTVRTGQLRVLR